jgi:uncharacterized protein (DUF697 family)
MTQWHDVIKERERLEQMKQMIEKSDNAVLIAVGTTAATGAIPIPFADAPLLIAEQVALMASISAIFKINLSKDTLKALAGAALGVSGITLVGRTIASNLLKLIPGAGSIAGGVISAGTAGIVTFALGKAYIELCKAVKMEKLNESDITSSKGVNMLTTAFEKQLKKEKK